MTRSRAEVDARLRALWVRDESDQWPTDAALAERLGLSVRTIGDYRRRLRLLRRKRTGWHHDDRLRELWVLGEDGEWPTDEALGQALGFSASTIKHRRSALGLARVRSWTTRERLLVKNWWREGRTDAEIVDLLAEQYPARPRPALHQVGKIRRDMECFRDSGRGTVRDYATTTLLHELERRGVKRDLGNIATSALVGALESRGYRVRLSKGVIETDPSEDIGRRLLDMHSRGECSAADSVD